MTPQQRDALRGKLAGLLGWVPHVKTIHESSTKEPNESFKIWVRNGVKCLSEAGHPIPDADLNALAAVWAERLGNLSWVVERFINGNGDWVYAGRARRGPDCLAAITDMDTEYDTRLALMVACFEAERKKA